MFRIKSVVGNIIGIMEDRSDLIRYKKAIKKYKKKPVTFSQEEVKKILNL